MSEQGSTPERGTANNRVVLAHGFTQTAKSWALFEELLTHHLPNIETSAVDLPGHGSAADLETDLWGCATHLVTEGEQATYIGYSLGGRVGLHAALIHANKVQRLVLIGATAGLESSSDRDVRREADNELASRIESLGVPSFIDEWLAKPLFAGLTDETSQRADRLRNTAEGLASSLRMAGTGTQDSLWERLSEIKVPVLVIAGESDKKFRAIGEHMVEYFPDSSLEIIQGAGHPVHLERPESTAEVIASWCLTQTAR